MEAIDMWAAVREWNLIKDANCAGIDAEPNTTQIFQQTRDTVSHTASRQVTQMCHHT